MDNLVFNNLQVIKHPKKICKCKCCGNSFEDEWWSEQDFCNRCYPVLVRELFNPENDKLTCKEFVNKMKIILEQKNDNSI